MVTDQTGADDPPEGQRCYRQNTMACTWGELVRSMGHPALAVLFIPAFAIVGVLKLFHIPILGGEVFPREIYLVPATSASIEPSGHALYSALTGLGFEHFGTYVVQGTPYHSLLFSFLNRAENAYANLYRVQGPMSAIVFCDLVTRFSAGVGLTTTHRAQAVAVKSPPGARKLLVRNAPPAKLWDAHRAAVADMQAKEGLQVTPVSPEDYVAGFRRAWRRFADFQEARGVWIPVATPDRFVTRDAQQW